MQSTSQGLLRLNRIFVVNILEVIFEGWKHVLKCSIIDSEASELEMNARLLDGMRSVLSKNKIPLQKNIAVFPAMESRSVGASLPDGFPDISVYLQDIRERHDDHGPHAIVECKRVVKSQRDLCRRYVKCGIDRFTKERYASDHAIGFMVGYVLRGPPEDTRCAINNVLDRAGRTVEKLRESTIYGIGTHVFESSHERHTSQTKIPLYHSLLIFSIT